MASSLIAKASSPLLSSPNLSFVPPLQPLALNSLHLVPHVVTISSQTCWICFSYSEFEPGFEHDGSVHGQSVPLCASRYRSWSRSSLRMERERDEDALLLRVDMPRLGKEEEICVYIYQRSSHFTNWEFIDVGYRNLGAKKTCFSAGFLTGTGYGVTLWPRK
ncbi:hypothetical protein V8G54_010674 [Vigna mungo]|uniref:Uncharacterized protein n=1 Tax=Vigna mungo TaxID=3915 RepID=A0AAQ3NZL2_VIGMU